MHASRSINRSAIQRPRNHPADICVSGSGHRERIDGITSDVEFVLCGEQNVVEVKGLVEQGSVISVCGGNNTLIVSSNIGNDVKISVHGSDNKVLLNGRFLDAASINLGGERNTVVARRKLTNPWKIQVSHYGLGNQLHISGFTEFHRVDPTTRLSAADIHKCYAEAEQIVAGWTRRILHPALP